MSRALTTRSAPTHSDAARLLKCRSTRSPSLFADQVGYGALGLDGLGRWPLRLPGRRHDALGDESVKDALAANRYDASDRSPAVCHDDLITITHPVEVAAQVVPEFPDADLHRSSLQRGHLWSPIVATSGAYALNNAEQQGGAF